MKFNYLLFIIFRSSNVFTPKITFGMRVCIVVSMYNVCACEHLYYTVILWSVVCLYVFLVTCYIIIVCNMYNLIHEIGTWVILVSTSKNWDYLIHKYTLIKKKGKKHFTKPSCPFSAIHNFDHRPTFFTTTTTGAGGNTTIRLFLDNGWRNPNSKPTRVLCFCK